MELHDKPRLLIKDGEVLTTSLAVAEHFGKRHKHVLDAIRTLIIESPADFNGPNFRPVEYIDAKGEKRPAYELTRDGFVLLVMGFTGAAALAWKIRYIKMFNAMERMLTERGEHEIVERVRGELTVQLTSQITQELLNRDALIIEAREVVAEMVADAKVKAEADAASLTAERIAHSMKIPPWSCEGGYLSEAFMLMFFGLERRFIDAALLWALYDTFGVHLETCTLSARAIVEASGGSLSATSVYLSRQRLIARGLLYGQPQAGRSDWRIHRERFEKMMRDTQLVAHVARVPAVLPEIHGANRKLAKWMEMPAPKAVQ